VVADDSRFSMAVDGPRMAFLFCVDLRDQRNLLRRLFVVEPASAARSCTVASRTREDRPVDQGSLIVSPRNRRSRDAVQRIAEACLSGGDLHLVAARHTDGTRDVAAHRYGVHRMGRLVRWT